MFGKPRKFSAEDGQAIVDYFKAKRPSKYRNVKTVVDGLTFDSVKEARRYQELRLLEKAGEIRDIQRQVKFPLDVTGPWFPPSQPIGCWIADFVYFMDKPERRIVEDVKGFRTPLYRWKKKHVEAQYGILIVEV